MSFYLAAGFLLAAVCVGAYLVQAARLKHKAELSNAIEIILAATGIMGGVKMIAFIATGNLSRLINLTNADKNITLKLSEEDIVFFVIGSFALIWVSAQTMLKQFKELKEQKTPQPIP